MSSKRSGDDWADAQLGETLHRTLGSMATQAGRASGLDAAMATVHSRVRRRRAVKKAGIGATTFAAAGALVVGGTTLLPMIQEPTPPGPAASPSPTTTGAPTELCGQQIDLDPNPGISMAHGFDLSGPAQIGVGTAWPAAISASGGRDGETIELRDIEIVATVDGEIVGVAAEPRWGGRIPVDDNTALTRDATLVGCADDAPLGPGSYDLYAQGVLLPGVGDLRFVTDPAPVEVVPAGGATATAEPTDEPSDLPTRGADEPSDECSAASLRSDTVPGFPGLPGPAAETATTLLAAALDCDAETLIALNEEDGTSTNFGGRTPEEFWTLPGAEEHEDVYANLAVLLTRVDFAEVPGSEETQPMYVWPRLQAGENSDAAWQEVVDVGLVTQEQADQMRAGEGYLGPRLGIAEDGTWMFFIAGD